MKLKSLFITINMFLFLSVAAQETKKYSFGEGVLNRVNKDSTYAIKIGARAQFLTASRWTSANNTTNPVTFFSVRRARLKLDGFAITSRLQYKLELGFTDKDISLPREFTNAVSRYFFDAVLKWNFSGNFVLWLGQAKLPGNRERVISSGDLQQVDRSLLNRVFNVDRGIGIQLRHHINITKDFIVKEMFAISQGEGRGITTGNLGGYQYTARIEVLPMGNFVENGDYVGSDLNFESTPKLALGISYDLNNNAVKNRSNLGAYMKNDAGFFETDVSTFFLDAMFKYKGFSFMGEYASRSANDPIAKNYDGSLTGDIVQVGNGLNLQTGYLVSKTVELSGRYTNISLDKNITGKGSENQYTLGVSKYIAGHKLKVQTDISYLDAQESNNEIMFRFQVDIHF
ncbi:porin [Flavobacteriaceae bacterium S356]|uniref:Porin n=1 Tax=Asprobacillus argus TaxID=3076534 RepID=A0ABU3LGV3_9FLAO|nr:porin [Flavobacteriaceae bacterium S356]